MSDEGGALVQAGPTFSPVKSHHWDSVAPHSHSSSSTRFVTIMLSSLRTSVSSFIERDVRSRPEENDEDCKHGRQESSSESSSKEAPRDRDCWAVHTLWAT